MKSRSDSLMKSRSVSVGIVSNLAPGKPNLSQVCQTNNASEIRERGAGGCDVGVIKITVVMTTALATPAMSPCRWGLISYNSGGYLDSVIRHRYPPWCYQ